MNITAADFEAFARADLVPFAFKILVALAILLVGRLAAKVVSRGLEKFMERSQLDPSVRKFLGDVLYGLMHVAVVVAALDAVGIETAAVLAILGAAGLAIGLALQGSLSNFAAGVMLIVLRPYKVGDLVVMAKYVGRVDAIRVFQTVLVTSDNREITIPNGQIIAQPIENLTVLGRRRVDLLVTVGCATDLGRVRSLLEGVLSSDSRIEQSPPATIELAEITDASLKLYLRPWTSTPLYTKVATEMMERIKTTMETAELEYSVSLQAVHS